jgi:hypothetical protein
LAAHDTASNPDMYDMLLKQSGSELSARARAQSKNLGPSRPAKASEIVVGAAVYDKTGAAMAKIEQVDQDGVILSLGPAKVKIPTDAFGHNKAGLLLDMTKAEFEQVVAKANSAG